MSDAEEYTLRWRGRITGPFSLAEINRQLDEYAIGLNHEICSDDQWLTLEEFLRPASPAPTPPPAASLIVIPAAAVIPPPQPPLPRVPLKVSSLTRSAPLLAPRQRLVFALFALLLGFLGAHNFYARNWLVGSMQLLLSIVTYIMGFGFIATWLWAMAEAFFLRKDGAGVEMI